MKTRTMLLPVILSACVTLISACDQDENDIGELTVGVVLPLSGSLEALGQTLKNATELALDEANQANAKKLRFLIEDSGSNPDGAVVAYNNLIVQEGVTTILGPTTSSASQAAFPLAQENQVVGFSPLAAASGLSSLGDYVFQANLTVDVVIPGGLDITAAKFGYQKVALLLDDSDLFSQSAYEVLVDTFNTKGIEVLTTETLATDDTDFSSQLGRIKDLDPDAIFISTLPNEAVGILTEAATTGFSEDVTFIIPFAFSTGEVEAAGTAAEGVVTFSTWISTATTPGNMAFVENYQQRFGTEPSRFVAQQYAAVHILAKAFNDAQSDDAAAIRDAMASINNLESILGKFSFDDSGQAVYDPIILQVNNGAFEIFE